MRRITPVLQRDAKVNRIPHNLQGEMENNTLKGWMDGWMDGLICSTHTTIDHRENGAEGLRVRGSI